MRRYLFPFLLFPFIAAAQVSPEERAPAPPTISDEAAEEQRVDTDQVEIVPPKQARVLEFRQNGRLYMVKVTPTSGPPYYIVDTNGDGSLDSVENGFERVQVPHWLIHSWE